MATKPEEASASGQRRVQGDADVRALFEAQGPGHQTRINAVLRDFMVKNRQRSTPEKV